MIIVRLIGGLGNQMFQYALGRHLAIKQDCDLLIDKNAFEKYKLHHYALGAYSITEKFISNKEVENFLATQNPLHKSIIYKKLFKQPRISKKHILEKQFRYDNEILQIQGPVYLDGYWQSELYFRDIRNTLLKDFTVKTGQEGKDKAIAEEISSSNSVSIHIRRGDYVSNTKTNEKHGTCSLSYYQNAISYLKERFDKLHFFIFSDDCQWAEENLKLDGPTTIIDHNGPLTNYEDLRLMSQCKHNIIANSSFSWWGGWLNQNANKTIIAPQKWFNDDTDVKDLIPESWILIQ